MVVKGELHFSFNHCDHFSQYVGEVFESEFVGLREFVSHVKESGVLLPVSSCGCEASLFGIAVRRCLVFRR